MTPMPSYSSAIATLAQAPPASKSIQGGETSLRATGDRAPDVADVLRGATRRSASLSQASAMHRPQMLRRTIPISAEPAV